MRLQQMSASRGEHTIVARSYSVLFLPYLAVDLLWLLPWLLALYRLLGTPTGLWEGL
jgi:hypothetical protein